LALILWISSSQLSGITGRSHCTWLLLPFFECVQRYF
jgi:hypothetical protein